MTEQPAVNVPTAADYRLQPAARGRDPEWVDLTGDVAKLAINEEYADINAGQLSGFQVISKPTRFFKVGRVFKCLWTEPAGDSSEDGGAYLTPLRFGEAAFTKVRHFIVVREMQNCSLCLPLNTHNRQGALKTGLRKQDYAAVFAEGSQPVLDPMEGIVRTSLPIIVENENETIDPMSRLNFGRVYTVEHNIKVAKVGRIGQDHIKLLDDYFLESIGKLPTPSNPDAIGSHVPNSSVNLDSTSYSLQGTRLADPSADRRIRGTPGETDKLEPSYRVRNTDYKNFFQTGKVFSTLWTDAYSDLSGPTSNVDMVNIVLYNAVRVHSKIRRFVVVRQGDRCCQCLPIKTFDGRGPTKKGINLDEHGLIYSSDRRPASFEGISKSPLKFKLSRGAQGLVNPSLVNYGRVYTVETNVKVQDMGELDSDSKKLIRRYFNEVNITGDGDSDGPGPPGPEVELAGVGAGLAVGFQGYSASLGLTPWVGATYNQPVRVWSNTSNFAPSGQNLYASNPLYGSQAGSTPTSTVRDTATIAANTNKPGSTSTSNENYQQASNYQSGRQPKGTQWVLEPESGRYYINWRDEYGRTIRRYADELEDGSKVASQVLSAREQFEMPRAPQSTVEYTLSPSEQSSRSWSPRESESYMERPEPVLGYGSYEPIRRGVAQDSKNDSLARRADILTIENAIGSPHPQYGSSGGLVDTQFSQDPVLDDDDVILPALEELQARRRRRN